MSTRSRLSFFKHGDVPRLSQPKSRGEARGKGDGRRRGRGIRPERGSENAGSAAPEREERLDLGALQTGDLLRVMTANTVYTFAMGPAGEAVLSTNRLDRPAGPVRLRGCTFGLSSGVRVDFLVCGANLEFLATLTQRVYRTSLIQAIFWLNRG